MVNVLVGEVKITLPNPPKKLLLNVLEVAIPPVPSTVSVFVEATLSEPVGPDVIVKLLTVRSEFKVVVPLIVKLFNPVNIPLLVIAWVVPFITKVLVPVLEVITLAPVLITRLWVPAMFTVKLPVVVLLTNAPEFNVKFPPVTAKVDAAVVFIIPPEFNVNPPL